jgi:hypothetical protein
MEPEHFAASYSRYGELIEELKELLVFLADRCFRKAAERGESGSF